MTGGARTSSPAAGVVRPPAPEARSRAAVSRPLAALWLLGLAAAAAGAAERYVSHPPVRPLPEPLDRAVGEGPARYVHPETGSDAADGSREAPWRTVSHGVRQLTPGMTLYLRGGTYYESVRVRLEGEPERPITLRGFPGEIAVLDGGFAEFAVDPPGSWEPWPAGGRGEYRSVRRYPELAAPPDARYPVFGSGRYSEEVRVLGNFEDSMVPLHGYRFSGDLRSGNPYWQGAEADLYCGPGLWLDPETERVHVRLAPTGLEALGPANYGGETDPRRVPLVIGGTRPVLDVERSRHVRIEGLVVRGTRGRTVNVDRSEEIVLDGVTVFGGAPAVYVRATRGLRIVHSALRGISAPWSSRACEKYKGISAYLFISEGRETQNHDLELAYSEFTDCQDGLILGTAHDVSFHHNLVDNFSDDALYLTAVKGLPGRNLRIFQNRISRCLSCLAFAGWGLGQEEAVAYVYRNVFDLRPPVHYAMPRGPEDREIESHGRLAADHASPIWRPMLVYQNTVVVADPPWRGFYGAGLASHMRATRRRLFNNVFVQLTGEPGSNFERDVGDLEVGGNLHWSLAWRPADEATFLQTLAAGVGARGGGGGEGGRGRPGDRLADPRFRSLSADWRVPLDVRARRRSPVRDAGAEIPTEWPDPLRGLDSGGPDVGALPLGIEPWRIGVRGRYSVTGGPR